MNKIEPEKPYGVETASQFVAARSGALRLDDYPGRLPQTMEEAYKIQDAAMKLRGGTVGGWKLGRVNPPFDSAMGTNRLAGPIFSDLIVTAPRHGTASMPVIARGFAAAEAEFLLRLSQNIAPGEAISGNLRDSVDRIAFGIEIASSPLPSINDLGPAVTASDFGNNHGLLVGPDVHLRAPLELDEIPVSLSVDGVVMGRGTTATMLDGPWGALRFLLDLAAARDIALLAGQWISTGAVTGVHQVAPGQRVDARFGETILSCAITRQSPTH